MLYFSRGELLSCLTCSRRRRCLFVLSFATSSNKQNISMKRDCLWIELISLCVDYFLSRRTGADVSTLCSLLYIYIVRAVSILRWACTLYYFVCSMYTSQMDGIEVIDLCVFASSLRVSASSSEMNLDYFISFILRWCSPARCLFACIVLSVAASRWLKGLILCCAYGCTSSANNFRALSVCVSSAHVYVMLDDEKTCRSFKCV